MHNLCKESAERLLADFQPQLMIAIGGGGYIPARILRSFLKQPGSPNIPIQAIGLSLYEMLPEATPSGATTPGAVEQMGTKVTRTPWLDLSSLGEMTNLVGKRILIVDEVDDTRTTLEYAVKELEKDVEAARAKFNLSGETQFGIFVLHVSHKRNTLPRLSLADVGKRRTRTSRRRALCPLPSPTTSDTLLRELLATSGFATPGRRGTLMSMTSWRRHRPTRLPVLRESQCFSN